MKIFQILNNFCYWDATLIHPTLESTKDLYAPEILFVEAPDYVFEHWGFDETKEGDERFIKPTAPEGWYYEEATGCFRKEKIEEELLLEEPNEEEFISSLEAMSIILGGEE